MGRSVSYLSDAEYVIYFTNEELNEMDDNNEHDYGMEEMEWDYFMINLKSSICHKLKSYYECNEYDGRETKIFLKNELAEIGISEYCGSYSLSIRAKEDEYDDSKENLGVHHCHQVRKTLEKALTDNGAKLFNRVGTFSNGVGVFNRI